MSQFFASGGQSIGVSASVFAFLVKRKQRNSTLYASLFKVNFPIKNPVTMAAVTTRSEGTMADSCQCMTKTTTIL